MKKRLQFLGRVGRDVFALVGASAAIGFYSAERAMLWLVMGTALLAGVAYLAYRIRREIERRTITRRARFTKPETVISTRLKDGAPPFRRVHVGFNPDTGDEITKLEAATWN
jgi:hypothetical protein